MKIKFMDLSEKEFTVFGYGSKLSQSTTCSQLTEPLRRRRYSRRLRRRSLPLSVKFVSISKLKNVDGVPDDERAEKIVRAWIRRETSSKLIKR